MVEIKWKFVNTALHIGRSGAFSQPTLHTLAPGSQGTPSLQMFIANPDLNEQFRSGSHCIKLFGTKSLSHFPHLMVCNFVTGFGPDLPEYLQAGFRLAEILLLQFA